MTYVPALTAHGAALFPVLICDPYTELPGRRFTFNMLYQATKEIRNLKTNPTLNSCHVRADHLSRCTSKVLTVAWLSPVAVPNLCEVDAQ
jgi:hypothetical protein